MNWAYLAGAAALWILSAFCILSTLWLTRKGTVKPGTMGFMMPVLFHAVTALWSLYLVLKALKLIG